MTADEAFRARFAFWVRLGAYVCVFEAFMLASVSYLSAVLFKPSKLDCDECGREHSFMDIFRAQRALELRALIKAVRKSAIEFDNPVRVVDEEVRRFLSEWDVTLS